MGLSTGGERLRDRQTERQTGRQTNRPAERENDGGEERDAAVQTDAEKERLKRRESGGVGCGGGRSSLRKIFL